MNLMKKYEGRLKPEPPKGISQGRLKTLDEVMWATILHYRDQIIKGGRWRPSEATRLAERRIAEIHREVMDGKGKLQDFAAACEEWQRIGETNNETIITPATINANTVIPVKTGIMTNYDMFTCRSNNIEKGE